MFVKELETQALGAVEDLIDPRSSVLARHAAGAGDVNDRDAIGTDIDSAAGAFEFRLIPGLGVEIGETLFGEPGAIGELLLPRIAIPADRARPEAVVLLTLLAV